MISMTSVLEVLRGGLSPAHVWMLVPRFVGAIYVVAFAGLVVQIRGLVGSRGVGPVRDQLAAARAHFGVDRFLRFPTVFWIHASDGAVVAAPLIGIAASFVAIVGGPWTTAALAVAYVMLLSLDAVGMWFPWDSMAFEAGALALLLPSSPALPSPLVAFAWRFFLVRVMWGFARVKFIGTRKGDSIYIKGFLGFMPQATPLGHRVYRLPEPILRAMYGFMWFAEVVCPGLTFFAGVPRLVGAAGLVSLMFGIMATGNWGWFNVGYALLCVVFLDARSSILDLHAIMPRDVLALGQILLGLFYFAATNTWSTLLLPRLPLDEGAGARSPLRALMTVVRALAPFRFAAGYGVFPPNSRCPLRPIPIFEGSRDGVHWEPYEYRFITSNTRTPPRFFAPHHPRIDHAAIYVTYGFTGGDYIQAGADASRVFGFYPFSRHHWLDRVAQRMLEGEPTVLALFGRCPFSADAPPKFVRAVLRGFEPTESQEDLARGVFWREHDLGVLLRPRESDPALWRRWQTTPETLHPALLSWRRASPSLRAMIAASAPPDEAVRVATDFDEPDVRRFWDEFVPAVARDRGDPAAADATARALEERYALEQLDRFERLGARFAYLLHRHLEPEFLRGRSPGKAMYAYFPLHLLTHEIMVDGRDAYLAALAAPPVAARERMARQTDATALHYLLVVHNERVHLAARAFRYFTAVAGHAPSRKVPGLAQYRPFLRERVRRPEERLPDATCHPNGVWTIQGTRPLPQS